MTPQSRVGELRGLKVSRRDELGGDLVMVVCEVCGLNDQIGFESAFQRCLG
jgi:hypothetical protein